MMSISTDTFKTIKNNHSHLDQDEKEKLIVNLRDQQQSLIESIK